MLVFSDLHLHSFTDLAPDRLKMQEDVLVKILEAARNDDKVALFCGDLTHKHGYIPTEVLDLLVRIFTYFSDVTVYCISGNHDQVYRNSLEHQSLSSIKILSKILNNVVCIDNNWVQVGDYRVFGIPYYANREDFYKVLELCSSEKGEFNILMLHQTPVGIFNEFIPAMVDLNHELLQGYDFIFMGHIHEHQDFGNGVYMVGNPIIIDASDYRQDKGYLVLRNNEVTFNVITTELDNILKDKKDAVKILTTTVEDKVNTIDNRFYGGIVDKFEAFCENEKLEPTLKDVGLSIIKN